MSAAAVTRLMRATRARREHRLADARQHLLEAAAISRQAGHRLHLALALSRLGQVEHHLGDVDAARARCAEAAAIYRETGSTMRLARAAKADMADALRSLAMHRESLNDVEQARRLWAEARELYLALDHPLRRLLRRPSHPGVTESAQHLARLGRA